MMCWARILALLLFLFFVDLLEQLLKESLCLLYSISCYSSKLVSDLRQPQFRLLLYSQEFSILIRLPLEVWPAIAFKEENGVGKHYLTAFEVDCGWLQIANEF